MAMAPYIEQMPRAFSLTSLLPGYVSLKANGLHRYTLLLKVVKGMIKDMCYIRALKVAFAGGFNEALI